MKKKLNTTRLIPLILASLLIFCACGASEQETSKETIPEGTYHFYKEMMPAESILDIEEIRFPQTINGFKVTVKKTYCTKPVHRRTTYQYSDSDHKRNRAV